MREVGSSIPRYGFNQGEALPYLSLTGMPLNRVWFSWLLDLEQGVFLE